MRNSYIVIDLSHLGHVRHFRTTSSLFAALNYAREFADSDRGVLSKAAHVYSLQGDHRCEYLGGYCWKGKLMRITREE